VRMQAWEPRARRASLGVQAAVGVAVAAAGIIR